MEGWSPGRPTPHVDGRGADTAGDAALARAWAAGDPRAFDEAYRRFAPALFGTAVGLLGDRSAAADVVHDTFVRAAPRVAGLRDPERLRAWLFAILRNEAASHHRARRHEGGSLDDPAGGEVTDRLVDGAVPADVEVSRAELAALVWTAADGLQDRDREVLELNVRGGLDTADLADALGVTPGHAAVLLSRMRDRLEKCLGALLVARAGRRDCDALDRLLAGWDGRFSLDVRSRVTRHVEGCLRCGRQRSAMVSLERLAPVLVPPAVLLPTDLRARLVSSLVPGGVPPAGGGWQWRDDGFPEQLPEPVRRPGGVTTPEDVLPGGAALLAGLPVGPPSPARAAKFVGAHRDRRRVRPVAVLAALAVLLLGGGAAVVAALVRGPDSVRVVADRPSASTTADAGPTPSGPLPPGATPPPTPSVSGSRPTGATSRPTTRPATSTRTSPTTSRTTPTTRTTPPTSSPPRTTPPTTRTPPPLPTLTLVADPGTVFAGGVCQPLVATVTATFTATAPVTITGTWSTDGTLSLPVLFTGTGGTRTGVVGPYRSAHVDTVSVTLTDANGSVTKTVTVDAQVCG